MSVLDIMNYVKSTPGNTNPAVIRSLVEGEQRSAVHEEVDSLKEKSVIGDVEWVPYAEIFKEHYGLEKEDLFLPLQAASMVKPFEEGQVLKVKTVHGATEGTAFVMEEDGFKVLIASNFATEDDFLGAMDPNYEYQLGDWAIRVIDYGELLNYPFPLYVITGVICSEGEKIEIFKRQVKAIDPAYIGDKVLIKSTIKEIEKIETADLYDSGIYIGNPNLTLMPGQMYLIDDGEKTQNLPCKFFIYFDEHATGLFEFMVVNVVGNLKLLANTGFLPDIFEDTKEDFVYVGGLFDPDYGQVYNICITTEPKTLTIKEVGYGNQFNYSAFEGKIGIDKEDGSAQKIDLKYLPEGIGHSQVQPKISWKYAEAVGNYTHVEWNSMMYYIKIADNFDLVNNMTGIRTRNIFNLEQNIDVSALNFSTVENEFGESCQAYITDGYDDRPIIYLVEDQFTIYNPYYSGGPVVLTRGLWVWEDDSDSRYVIEIHSGEEEKVYHIPQKFIPALDSITLNGANGKQYSLTVDTNGQLSVKLI